MSSYPPISPEAMAVALALDKARIEHPEMSLKDALHDLLGQPSTVFDPVSAFTLVQWLEQIRPAFPDENVVKAVVVMSCNQAVLVSGTQVTLARAKLEASPKDLIAGMAAHAASKFIEPWGDFINLADATAADRNIVNLLANMPTGGEN